MPVSPMPSAGDSGVMYTVGTWRGAVVRWHWTTLLMLALITELVATWLPGVAPRHSPVAYWFAGLTVSTLFTAAVLVHELAHAVAARHYGMTPKSITLWMLGGATDLGAEPPSARAEALIGLAGPAATAAVGALAASVAWLMPAGLFAAAFGWLATMSVILAVFNLIPAVPFDGGAVLRGVIWWRHGSRARAVQASMNAGRVIGLVLVVFGAAELLLGFVAGVWLMLIGWLVRSAASARPVPTPAVLDGVPVERAMTPVSIIAPTWWTVARLCADLSADGVARAAGNIPVVDLDGSPVAVVSDADLSRVPAARRDELRIAELVARRPAPVFVAAGDAAHRGGATAVRHDVCRGGRRARVTRSVW